jgi:hypothetical protein
MIAMTALKTDAFLRSLGQHLAAAAMVALLVGGPALVDAARDGLAEAQPLALAALDLMSRDAPALERGTALWMR